MYYIYTSSRRCPTLENVRSISRYNVVQAEHGVNIENQVNGPKEEDDNNNIVEYDGTNRLIQVMLTRTDHGNFHDVHDVPLLGKSKQPLYEGSRKKLIYATLLLVNLNALNGL